MESLTGYEEWEIKDSVSKLFEFMRDFKFEGQEFHLDKYFPLLGKLPSHGKNLLQKRPDFIIRKIQSTKASKSKVMGLTFSDATLNAEMASKRSL